MARSRFNLLTYPASLLDPPSFYRCMGPLTALRRKRPSLEIIQHESLNWVTLGLTDAVFFERPFSANQVEIAALARRHGVPIWIDHDDHLFAVPKDNPGHDMFMRPENQKSMFQLLLMADVITTSTQALADDIGRFVKTKPVVVPNALMTHMVGNVPNHDGKKRNNIVMWRGSTTHQRDLDTHTMALVEMAKKHADTEWLFVGLGGANYRLLELIDKARRAPSVDVIDYFGELSVTLPRVVIVPLADHEFNRCKSNIAWIEATFAGAVCVAPGWPEWQRPGVLNYADKDGFAKQLDHALSMSDAEQNQRWLESAKYIEENLTIDTTNHIRSGVLSKLEELAGDQAVRNRKRSDLAYRSALERAQ